MQALQRLVRILLPAPPRGDYDDDGFPREHPSARERRAPKHPGAEGAGQRG